MGQRRGGREGGAGLGEVSDRGGGEGGDAGVCAVRAGERGNGRRG